VYHNKYSVLSVGNSSSAVLTFSRLNLTLAVTNTYKKTRYDLIYQRPTARPATTFLDELGLRAAACRRRLALWEIDGQISLAEAMACLAMINRECPEPTLALQIANKINLNQLGVLGYSVHFTRFHQFAEDTHYVVLHILWRVIAE
jgi:hypothetical protein